MILAIAILWLPIFYLALNKRVKSEQTDFVTQSENIYVKTASKCYYQQLKYNYA